MSAHPWKAAPSLRLTPAPERIAAMRVIPRGDLDRLFDALAARGYTIIGPRVREQAIVFDEVRSTADLPIGWTDEQEGGHYRLRRRDDKALFGYNVGPHSWKRFQLPPDQTLFTARRGAIAEEPADPARYAFVGARSCDLHAMGILDRVLARREDAFVVAVQCGQAAATCFCSSMGTGPKAESGFDIALTEVLDGGEHSFVAEEGTERGAELLDAVSRAPAQPAHEAAAAAAQANAVAQMGRTMDTHDIRDLLQRNLEHPRWDDVAARCLTCGNCTMVCPTCFCTTVEDVTDLSGDEVVRTQRWDSCFTVDYSHIHGGSVRASSRSRYRQWMTHKLSTWFDQFDSSGCVGCGRCITWCPVGIDITEEVAAIRATEGER
jgi:sulfhydrogenase subunit beta (sulfur reductase)